MIQKADACKTLQLPDMRTVAVPELSKAVKLLERNHVHLPTNQVIEITGRLVRARFEAISAEKMADWACSTWPFPSNAQAPWVSEDASFASCWTYFNEDTDKEGNKLEMVFKKVWYETVFSEVWVRAFLAAGKEEDSGENILSFATALLKEYENGDRDDQLPEWAHSAVSIMRAIVALVSPVPGLHGAKLRDVKYLIPDGKTSTMARDLGMVGAIMFNQARTQPIWETRKMNYIKAAGAECSQGALLREMMAKAREYATPVEDGAAGQIATNDKMDLLKQYRETKDTFSELRAGAECSLEFDLVDIMKRDWDACKHDEELLGNMASQYVETLKIMRVDGASQLQQDISDAMSQVQFASSAKAFDVALEAFVSNPSEDRLKQVVNAGEGVQGGGPGGADLPESTLDRWNEALSKVVLNLLLPRDLAEDRACTGQLDFLKLCIKTRYIAKLRLSRQNLNRFTSVLGGLKSLCKAFDRAKDVMQIRDASRISSSRSPAHPGTTPRRVEVIKEAWEQRGG